MNQPKTEMNTAMVAKRIILSWWILQNKRIEIDFIC